MKTCCMQNLGLKFDGQGHSAFLNFVDFYYVKEEKKDFSKKGENVYQK